MVLGIGQGGNDPVLVWCPLLLQKSRQVVDITRELGEIDFNSVIVAILFEEGNLDSRGDMRKASALGSGAVHLEGWELEGWCRQLRMLRNGVMSPAQNRRYSQLIRFLAVYDVYMADM